MTIKVSQTKMTTNLIVKYDMEEAKTKTNPLSPANKLTKLGEPLDTSIYNELISSLLYLSVCTRPDIAHAVGALSRYMSKPTTGNLTAAKGVLKYLASTVEHGIMYGPSIISCTSRLQATVAVLTAEAEYLAAAQAVKKALWLHKLIADIKIPLRPSKCKRTTNHLHS